MDKVTELGDKMIKRKRGLGRGIDALIPSNQNKISSDYNSDSPDIDKLLLAGGNFSKRISANVKEKKPLVQVPGITLANIPIDSIVPNRKQPRTAFDESELAELKDSINEIGLLQPIVVRKITKNYDKDKALHYEYEIISGERRWRACKLAHFTDIVAIVRSVDDQDMLRNALMENLHRSELNAIEEALAYQQLLNDFGCTQEQLSQKVAKSRAQIANTIRLLRLPHDIQEMVVQNKISYAHARTLLAIEDKDRMIQLANRVVEQDLSVRRLEQIVAEIKNESENKSKKRNTRNTETKYKLIAKAFASKLNTEVKITEGRKKKIVISYNDKEDLDRIAHLIGVEGFIGED